eukprot:TRINITY_DN8700_c0_g1_i11.p1 TRINITY_DN8700_c0_g1~~TRINITY_DN8700_c0_g1_i11.p1  ORF type:complete len:306 (+),score=18.56 TRINITY_DN8700_c0_g1_i11:76-993(+)
MLGVNNPNPIPDPNTSPSPNPESVPKLPRRITCHLSAAKQAEAVSPHRIAYDRPSPKLLGFLAKHYGLKAFTPQENNFVVYHKYFDDAPEVSGRRIRRNEPQPVRPAVALLTSTSGVGQQPQRGRSGSRQQHSTYQCQHEPNPEPAGATALPVQEQHEITDQAMEINEQVAPTSNLLRAWQALEQPSRHNPNPCHPSRLKPPTNGQFSHDQNSVNSPVRRGVRGLRGMSRCSHETRGRIPVLPSDMSQEQPHSSRQQEHAPTSQPSHSSRSSRAYNFLHHLPQQQEFPKRDYQASYTSRKASWWG